METITRVNSASNTHMYEGGPAVEVLLTNQDRYIDPLVRDKIHDIKIARHRRRVSEEDPLGQLITGLFAAQAWAKFPKFFDSEEPDANEIMEDVRQFCVQLDLGTPCARLTKELATHGGHCNLLFWIEDLELKYQIYTPEDYTKIKVDGDNQPVEWEVQGKMPETLEYKFKSYYRPESIILKKGMPGLITHVRGDELATRGNGESRFIGGWDALTKLRQASHGDAFRESVFPICIIPPDWPKKAAKKYFQKVAKMDQTTALVQRAAKDDTGKLYDTIPAVSWISPGTDASKPSETGIRGLSPEYVRFCARYGISIRELSGDPAGQQESAQADMAEKLEKNILEFNLYRDILKKIIEGFAAWKDEQTGQPWANWKFEPGFIIKGHWEYELHAMQVQEQEMMERDMQATEDQANRDNKAVSWASIVGRHLGIMPVRMNAPPAGIMMPITSSWVKSYGWSPGTSSSSDPSVTPGDLAGNPRLGDQGGGGSFFMQFHGSQGTFEYPGVTNPEEVATAIEMSGSPGGFVHDHPELGVPARTPYKRFSGPGGAPGMDAFGGQEQLDQVSEAARAEKVAAFGSLRPAGPDAQTMYGQGAQTAAATESTTRHFTGTTADEYDLYDITQAISALDPTPGVGEAVSGIGPASSTSTPASTGTPTTLKKPGRRAKPGKGAGPGRPAPAQYGTTSSSGVGFDSGTGGYDLKKPGRRKRPGRGAGPGRPGPSQYGTSYSNDAPDPRMLSFKKFKIAMNEAGILQVGSSTYYKMRKILNALEPYVFRENYLTQGNSMDFNGHLYKYLNRDGTLSVERPCKKDWKLNMVGHKVELTLRHGGPTFGTCTYGWDDETDQPFDIRDYDKEALMEHMRENNDTDNEIFRRLLAGEEPDGSTEYRCRVQVHNGVRWQRSFQPLKYALVEEGNCPSGVCDFTPVQ